MNAAVTKGKKLTQRKLSIVATLLSILLVSASLTIAGAGSVAPTPQWTRTFGYSTASAVSQTNDENLLVAVQSDNDYQYTGHLGFQYNNLSGKLIKVDLKGQILWNKSLPILPEVMVASNDSGFIIAGETRTLFGYAQTDVSTYPIYQTFASLVKVDAEGIIVWNQTYNLPKQPIPNPSRPVDMGVGIGANVKTLLQTSDGGYLIGGSYSTNSSLISQLAEPMLMPKPWLMKTDSLGKSLWTKVYNLDSNSTNSSIGFSSISSTAQTNDGGFLLISNINGFALTKIDFSGNILWGNYSTFRNNGQNFTTYNSIARAPDGGYLLAGNKYYYSNAAYISFPYIAKLSDNFDQLWTTTQDKQALSDFKLRYVSNAIYLFSTYNSVLETDLAGNIIWSETYNGTINALCPTVDGGYALAGEIKSDPNSIIDTMYIWLEKLAFNSAASPPLPTLSPTTTSSPAATPTSTQPTSGNPSPSVPEFPLWFALPLAIVVVLAAVFARKTKSKSGVYPKASHIFKMRRRARLH